MIYGNNSYSIIYNYALKIEKKRKKENILF